jgi:hypothetical protein
LTNLSNIIIIIMGLGFSVENLGNHIVDKKDQHVVTEGLALAAAYIAIRYIHISLTREKMIE